jgi:hypothetical protein
MTAGQKSPRVEKQMAPTKEMIGPKFGTAMATATENEIIFTGSTFHVSLNMKLVVYILVKC